jgi:hypothetical protein
MKVLERKITREQAQLLFDDVEGDVSAYVLRLIPLTEQATTYSRNGIEYDDRTTEHDAMEFIGSLSGRLFSEAR